MSDWIKIIARSCYPLQWSAGDNIKFEGINLSFLKWRQVSDIIIKYDTPLAHLFINKNDDGVRSNFSDLISEENTKLKKDLQDIIDIIERDLKIESGDQKSDLEIVYNKMKYDFGIMVMGFSISQIVANKLKNELGEEDFERLKQYALSPFKKTLISKEHEGIEKLKIKFLKSNIDEDKLIQEAQKLAERFGFIHSEYRGDEWTSKEYLEEIKISNIINDNFGETGPININSLNLSQYHKWLMEISRLCYYIFDEGKSVLVRSNWALRKTINNLGLDEKKIMNLTEKEFLEWLKTEKFPNYEIMKDRTKYYALFLKETGLEEYTGKKEVEKILSEEKIDEFEEISQDVHSLIGHVANKGEASGKVRVVFSQGEANKLEEGEILVTSMTTPELISAMRRASAFITDEGGITCHAAIISRELGKPCIVGTKNATKVLKDGDYVEVDANEGVVRIIKKV